MHAEGTKHVLPGRKSPGCPEGSRTAVGTVWGPEHNEMSAAPKFLARRKSLAAATREADPFYSRERPTTQGKKGKRTMRYRRVRGPSIPGRIRRDNVGKMPLAAGSGHNLQ